MSSAGMDRSGRHDQGRVFVFLTAMTERLGRSGAVLRRLANQSRDWRSCDRCPWAGGGGEFHGAGIWRSEDGGTSWKVTRLTKGRWMIGLPTILNFAKMIGWTGEPLPFNDAFAQTLVARLRARHAVCRHQTSEPSGQ